MDRRSELVNIYGQSKLQEVLTKKRVDFHESENFTKLLFEKNEWKLRSIEIYDTLKGPYFRIHHQETVADWIKTRIENMPGTSLRSSNKTGSSIDGDPLHISRQLRELLRLSSACKSVWPTQSHDDGGVVAPLDENPANVEASPTLMLKALKDINASILEFVALPENDWLSAYTRSYSTPFRGTLFGQVEQVGVAAELSKIGVDVLILGANPNNSGEKNPSEQLKYRDLADQMATGLYSEAHWESTGVVVPGWVANEKNSWNKMLYEPLRVAGAVENRIAFANYLPWGSANLAELVSAVEPALLKRMVAFADELLARIVITLRPRLVIAPHSISNNLADSLLTSYRKEARLEEFGYPANRRETYRIFHSPAQIGGWATQLLHLRHPSSMQVSAEAITLISERLHLFFRQQLDVN